MNESYPLVVGDQSAIQDYSEIKCLEPVFLFNNSKSIHLKETDDEVLNFLVFSILRKPKGLLVHLQRISLCYEKQDEDFLYAALVDLFVVLQGAGLSIKRRMLAGSRKHLSAEIMQQLQSYINGEHLIQGNLYSVLTSGTESDLEMVVTQVKETVSCEHDSLQIARDYIEYSQLEEARDVLEDAILADPEYIELHEDLLELYKSTRDIDAFNTMVLALSEIDHPMQAQWDELSSYFNK